MNRFFSQQTQLLPKIPIPSINNNKMEQLNMNFDQVPNYYLTNLP